LRSPEALAFFLKQGFKIFNKDKNKRDIKTPSKILQNSIWDKCERERKASLVAIILTIPH